MGKFNIFKTNVWQVLHPDLIKNEYKELKKSRNEELEDQGLALKFRKLSERFQKISETLQFQN